MKSFLLLLASVIKLELNYRKFDVLDFFLQSTVRTVGCKKNGNCQNKIDTFFTIFSWWEILREIG
jgi:hypothetical protein